LRDLALDAAVCRNLMKFARLTANGQTGSGKLEADELKLRGKKMKTKNC
jgi:hypothetical protein